MATATTATKPKAIVTSKLMADGTMKTVASKLITNRLQASLNDAAALSKVPALAEKAVAARDAIDNLLSECSE